MLKTAPISNSTPLIQSFEQTGLRRSTMILMYILVRYTFGPINSFVYIYALYLPAVSLPYYKLVLINTMQICGLTSLAKIKNQSFIEY